MTTRLFATEIARPANAENLTGIILKCFRDSNIPVANIISFMSDSPNVMRGKHGGVFKRLQQEVPHVLDTGGCHLHHVHNSAAAAAKMLKEPVSEFLVDVFTFFKYSAERRAGLEDCQELLGIEAHKLLELSSTRWLCIEAVVSGILR